MKVFAIALVALIAFQVAVAAPGRKSSSCGCDDDADDAAKVSHSDRLLIQRVKSSKGATRVTKPIIDDSEESEESCSGSWAPKAAHKSYRSHDSSASSSSEEDDDCTQVSAPQVVNSGSRCEENEKIYLHRQAPIYVRPPPSRIFINHPPVVVRQPPVILHHQSRSPVLVKPILIKEREVAARPVLFKISKPDSQVSVSKCENPKVVVDAGCPKSGSGCSGGCSSGCSCSRKEKDC